MQTIQWWSTTIIHRIYCALNIIAFRNISNWALTVAKVYFLSNHSVLSVVHQKRNKNLFSVPSFWSGGKKWNSDFNDTWKKSQFHWIRGNRIKFLLILSSSRSNVSSYFTLWNVFSPVIYVLVLHIEYYNVTQCAFTTWIMSNQVLHTM